MADHEHEHEEESDEDARVTAPMQEFSTGQAMIGLVIVLFGLLVVFGVPILLG
ncbi:MAG: DUF7550 family protein [Halobacteriota archaeon]